MKTLKLIGIESGDICPDTGTWYANYQDDKGKISYDRALTFRQGEIFPKFNGKSTKWTYLIEFN